MIRTIIFDVDGTLYNESDVKTIAELYTAEYISKKTNIAIETIYDLFRKEKAEITSKYKGLTKANDRNLWYEAVLKELEIYDITKEEASEHYWNVIYEHVEPFPDFIYVLPELRQKYKLYILTDELFEIHKKKLKCLGLEDAFIQTISSEQVGVTKPSTKLFQYALDIVGEAACDVIMVGDSPSADVKGGNLAGMHTAWLKRGKNFYYPQRMEEKADITFTNYIQLIAKIESFEKSRINL